MLGTVIRTKLDQGALFLRKLLTENQFLQPLLWFRYYGSVTMVPLLWFRYIADMSRVFRRF